MDRKIYFFVLFLFVIVSCEWKKTSKEKNQKGEKDSFVLICPEKDSVFWTFVPFVNQDVYFYEDTVEIAGYVSLLNRPESLDKIYALSLEETIQVLPKEKFQDKEDPNVLQVDVREIQLLLESSFNEMFDFLNKKIVFKGILWGRYSGDHYTPVILDVISMQREKDL